jgi:hypothetical protein
MVRLADRLKRLEALAGAGRRCRHWQVVSSAEIDGLAVFSREPVIPCPECGGDPPVVVVKYVLE